MSGSVGAVDSTAGIGACERGSLTTRTGSRRAIASKQEFLNRTHLLAIACALEKRVVLLHIGFQPDEISAS